MDPSVREITELLDAVATKVPNLISSIMKSIYSEEAGANMGKAVGNLYKELVEAGIPTETALKMATDYMISLKDLLSQK